MSLKDRLNLPFNFSFAMPIVVDNHVVNAWRLENQPHLSRIVDVEHLVGTLNEPFFANVGIGFDENELRFWKMLPHQQAILFLDKCLGDDQPGMFGFEAVDALDDLIKKCVAHRIVDRTLRGDGRFHVLRQVVVTVVYIKVVFAENPGDIGFARPRQAKGNKHRRHKWCDSASDLWRIVL